MAKTSKINLKTILWLAFGLRLILVLISGWHPDLPNHTDWGNRFLIYGSRDFYEHSIWGVSWPNQPFGSILLFALIAVIHKFLFNFILSSTTLFLFFHLLLFPF